jgi:hypothetical protein
LGISRGNKHPLAPEWAAKSRFDSLPDFGRNIVNRARNATKLTKRSHVVTIGVSNRQIRRYQRSAGAI